MPFQIKSWKFYSQKVASVCWVKFHHFKDSFGLHYFFIHLFYLKCCVIICLYLNIHKIREERPTSLSETSTVLGMIVFWSENLSFFIILLNFPLWHFILEKQYNIFFTRRKYQVLWAKSTSMVLETLSDLWKCRFFWYFIFLLTERL